MSGWRIDSLGIDSKNFKSGDHKAKQSYGQTWRFASDSAKLKAEAEAKKAPQESQGKKMDMGADPLSKEVLKQKTPDELKQIAIQLGMNPSLPSAKLIELIEAKNRQ